MLRGNLSTRPFYNDRLVSLGILVAIVLTLALTAFNVTQIMSLTEQRSAYTTQIEHDRQEADRYRSSAAAIGKSIDQKQLTTLVASTREANRLIDQRTFSWTAFFDGVEKTLPLDARLVAVAPRVEKGAIQIVMIVVVKSVDDLEAFTKALENSGMFYDIGPREQTLNDDGTLTSRIQGGYLPPAPAPEAAAPAAPKAATRPGGRGRP
jgi:hypothetical protein